MDRMRRDLFAVSVDDAETRDTIARVYAEHGALLEPHGAVGWAGLERWFAVAPDDRDITAISLETAHPAKFPDEVRALTGVEPPLPPSLEGIEEREEHYGELPVDYDAFKTHLIKEYR
jgi:threonine synthase